MSGRERSSGYADEVVYGERVIPFDVVRSERTTLGIHVHPSGHVEVRAPLDADAEDIRVRVRRRARWVAKHQRRFAEFVRDRPQKAYVNGETHRYLGRQYRLKVLPLEGIGQQRQQRVRLVGRYFEIHTTKPDKPTHTRALLARWFRTKAEVRLRERFVLGCERMAKYGVEPPPLQVRRMERRWGSCTASGRVLLNPRLIHTPTACIDYVVLHELCHFRHPHHGPAFYALLERVMPDWKGRKERLERIH